MHPTADLAGAEPRRDHRSLARVSRHEVPKTAGEDARKYKRPRQGVALIRESGNQCDTLAGSRSLVMPDPRVFGATPLDLWLWSGHPQGVHRSSLFIMG